MLSPEMRPLKAPKSFLVEATTVSGTSSTQQHGGWDGKGRAETLNREPHPAVKVQTNYTPARFEPDSARLSSETEWKQPWGLRVHVLGLRLLSSYLCFLGPPRGLLGPPSLCVQKCPTHHARGASGVVGRPCPCLGEKRSVLC